VAITVDSEDRTSGLSNEVSAQPYELGDMPGPVLFATAGNRQILLGWHLSNPEPDHMPAGYKLYRGLASGAEDPQPVYEVQTTELAWEWLDTDVRNGTEYFYSALRKHEDSGAGIPARQRGVAGRNARPTVSVPTKGSVGGPVHRRLDTAGDEPEFQRGQRHPERVE